MTLGCSIEFVALRLLTINFCNRTIKWLKLYFNQKLHLLTNKFVILLLKLVHVYNFFSEGHRKEWEYL